MAVPGENIVPLGRAGSGAAYVLGGNAPSALSVLMQGQRARDLAARQAAAAKLKADQENAKQFNDFAKFQQDGSPYFGEALNSRVYQPVMGQLTDVFKNNRDDLFARNAASQPILQRTNNETVQSQSKSKYITDQMRGFQADKNLYNTQYAGEKLSAALRNEDGTGRLPSEMDAEAHFDNLRGDHNLYNEGEVVKRATNKLAPIISQKVAEAGQLGGIHTADQVRGRFVAFDGKGHPIYNGDGSPKLNLTSDTQALLESDPLFKLKVDAREAAYNAKREADPSLPQMSRRGHIAQMVGPLAFYDQTHDETRIRPHFESASKGKEKGFVPNDGTLVEGEYPATLPAAAPAYAGLKDDKGTPIGYDFSQQGAPQKSFEDLGQGKQPILKTASGDLKAKHTDAIKVRSYYTEDGNGNFTEVKNNVIPQAGVFGPSTVVAVDIKTNKPLFDKSREEQKRLIASGAARPQMYIDLAADKNEKFAADKSRVLKQLIAANSDPSNFNKKSPAELEDQATKIVSKGVTRHFIPYDAQNALIIDQETGGHYQATFKSMRAKYKMGQGGSAAAPAAPAKKASGVDFGTSKPSAAAPVQGGIKRAGTKKTGISF